jgi:molybdopterin/thiamine biosynthesis adenylyltransferase
LHGGSGGSFGRRRLKAQQDHLIEEEIFLHDKIDTNSARNLLRNGADIGEISQPIQGFESGRDLRWIERLANFERDGIASDAKNLAAGGNYAKFSNRSGSLIRGGSSESSLLSAKTGGHSSAEERREHHDAPQSHTIRPHAPNLLRRRVAQGRCLLPYLAASGAQPERKGHWSYHRQVSENTKAGNHLRTNPTWERYSRQILFAGMGEEGQRKLLESSAVVVGCGAIGASTAQLLARAGVGKLRVIDRDLVEPSNLQRQALFEENDAREALPKAVAAERKLRLLNSEIEVEGVVADVMPGNVKELLDGFDLILDGTDNFETRFLLNDYAVQAARSWIYAAAVGSYCVMLAIRPSETACLACLMESPDAEPLLEETCDTVGVLGPAVNLVSSLEAAEALKFLSGNTAALHGRLISCDVWSGRMQSVGVARDAACRVCARREFSYLEGEAQPHITMCGRDSVQIHERRRVLDLAALQANLAAAGLAVKHNDFLLKFSVPPYEMTVFGDGRAILRGSRDPAVARSLYARYIGA